MKRRYESFWFPEGQVFDVHCTILPHRREPEPLLVLATERDTGAGMWTMPPGFVSLSEKHSHRDDYVLAMTSVFHCRALGVSVPVEHTRMS